MNDELRDELDQLIEDYADGALDTEQARRLLERIEASPEARARLASTVALERLLRALGRGPVPVERIMSAVAARRSGQGPRPPSVPRARGTARSVLIAAAALTVLITAIAYLLRPPRAAPLAAHAGPSAPPSTSAPRPTPASAPTAATASATAPPIRVRIEPDAPPVTPAPEVEVEVRPVYPQEIPTAPEEPAPPAGDGSHEPGFVAPPRPVAQAAPPTSPATVPLLWTRVSVDESDRWSATPGDVEALVAALQARLGARYRANERTFSALSADPTQNPILLFSTHHRFAFDMAQRAFLRRFVLAGGMVVFDAGMGSAPAAESARREALRIFPDLPLRRLAPDHPLFHAGYDVTTAPRPGAAAPALEAVTIDCRAAFVIAPCGLAAGWLGLTTNVAAACAAEDALRLGLNLSTYGAAVRAWARQGGGNPSLPVDLAPAAGRLSIAQIIHGGEWRTRPAALALLLRGYNLKTDVPVKLRVADLRLDDPEAFRAPLLYVTGHDEIAFTEAETLALRRHLESGGFLLAEACCGRRAFDQSFRAWIARVLPGHALEPVPADDELLRTPNRVDRIAATRSLAAKAGAELVAPRLEGIRIGGHFAVVYSPIGLAGAWESSPIPYADAYDGPAALRLGQNILQYALTH